MDFIERLFGVSPDGGDGTLEAAWVAALVLAVVAVVFRGRVRNWMVARSSARRK